MEDGSKKKNQKTEEKLPQEMIDAILSRLPVKPLCRFKLVSKSWQSLISDPSFLANYSKAAVDNKDVFLSRRRLFFNILFGSKSQVYTLNLDQFLIKNDHIVDGMVTLEAVPTEVDIVCDHFVQEQGWFVRGSCSGLFLLQSTSVELIHSLINPVTKETKTLPNVPLPRWRLPREPDDLCLCGFGFDYSTNDYKVINGQQYADGVVFSVYTLQTGSWRQIEYLFPYIVLDLDGIMVSGGVHWLVKKVEDGSLAIISFLLAEEEVREIALPPNATGYSSLGAFRNWLCVTSSSSSEFSRTCNEFWVMKKYGASESWTEMRVSIPYKELSHSGFWTETHDLMVFDGSSLVMYNFDNDKFWTLSIGKDGVILSFGVYVEALHTLTHRSRASSSKEGDGDIIEC